MRTESWGRRRAQSEGLGEKDGRGGEAAAETGSKSTYGARERSRGWQGTWFCHHLSSSITVRLLLIKYESSPLKQRGFLLPFPSLLSQA